MKGKLGFKIAGLIFFGLMLHLAGCSSSDSTGNNANPNLQWGKCPTYFGDEGLECTTVEVPLNHDNPNGEAIHILMARAVGNSTEKKGDVWFIAGGPGSSSQYYAENMVAYAKSHPQWNYYTMEHRGVGASTKLDCPNIEPTEPWGSFYGLECYEELETQWGDGVQYFNTSQAAHDLGSLISLTRRSQRSVFIYGTSYGTYLAQRFMCLKPQPVNGVVLDGVCPAGLLDNMGAIGWYDQDFDKVGRAIMERCGADSVCSEKMRGIQEIAGTEPWQAVEYTFNQADEGKLCQPLFAGLDPEVLRVELRNVLGTFSHNWSQRMLVPAILYRLNRCNDGDQEALKQLLGLDQLLGASRQSEQSADLKSAVIRTNIVVSELLGPGIDYATASAYAEESFFSTDFTVSGTFAREAGGWPAYPLDGCADRFPDTETPILILNGDLDPNTYVDLARFAAEAYDKPHQRLVVMPGVPHGAIFESRMEAGDTINTCAMELALQFFDDPEKSLDRSCLAQMIQPDFSGTTPWALEAAKAGFGRDSMWD